MVDAVEAVLAVLLVELEVEVVDVDVGRSNVPPAIVKSFHSNVSVGKLVKVPMLMLILQLSSITPSVSVPCSTHPEPIS